MTRTIQEIAKKILKDNNGRMNKASLNRKAKAFNGNSFVEEREIRERRKEKRDYINSLSRF